MLKKVFLALTVMLMFGAMSNCALFSSYSVSGEWWLDSYNYYSQGSGTFTQTTTLVKMTLINGTLTVYERDSASSAWVVTGTDTYQVDGDRLYVSQGYYEMELTETTLKLTFTSGWEHYTRY